MNNTTIASLFESVRSKKAAGTLNLQEFLEFFNEEAKHMVIENKDDAPVFSLCTYGPADSRKQDNIVSVNGIALDCDIPIPLEKVLALIEKLQQLGVVFVVYSTYTSKPDAYKLRIVCPLATPVSPDKYQKERFAARLAQKLGIEIDSESERATQAYYIPACPPGNEDFQILHCQENGRLLEESELPELTEISSKPPTSQTEEKTTIEEIVSDILAKLCDGVEPVFFGNEFWLYMDGVWCQTSAEMFASVIFNNVFERKKITPGEVGKIIAWLKVATYDKSFPALANDELVNFNGKTWNARTGEMVANSPDHYIRTLIPHEIDLEAKCPLFMAFLEQIFKNDPDAEAKQQFLQQYLGYLLMSTAKLHKMLWLLGEGSNGKSVLVQVIRAMLGHENTCAVSLAALSGRFAVAAMVGKLANVVDEAGADFYIDDAKLKNLISGGRQEAEKKGVDAFDFDPFVRFVVATNHLPNTRDASHGFFRRFEILELRNRVEEKDQDPDLPQKLIAEMPGIVAFAARGAQTLLEAGKFVTVPSSLALLEQYKLEANPLAIFANEVLDIGAINPRTREPHRIKTTDLYAIYKLYCAEKGYKPLSDSTFGKRMKPIFDGTDPAKSGDVRYRECAIKDPQSWHCNKGGELERLVATHVQRDDAEATLPENVKPISRRVVSLSSEFPEEFTAAA